MVLTNQAALYERMVCLRAHGITRDPAILGEAAQEPWYYQQIALGYNYRLTDLQAALGVSQLERLAWFVAQRRRLAARYDAALADWPLHLPWQHPEAVSAWHLYVIRLDLAQITRSRRQVFAALRAAGIGVNIHYIPVHLQPHYQRLGFAAGDFPEAERYYAEALSLPLFPTLSEEQQQTVLTALQRALA